MKKLIITIIVLGIGFGHSIKATDFNVIDNSVYIQPLSANAGENVAISICMNNVAPIRGFQFKLFLPEGVSAVKNDKGKIQAFLNKTRMDDDDEHTLSVSEQDDGSILFLCGSQYAEDFTVGDGELVVLQVSIAKSTQSGDYPLLIKDIKLTETNISKYYVIDVVNSVLTINKDGESVNIESLTPAFSERDGEWYTVEGLKLNGRATKSGVYVVNGKKVVVK